MNRHTARVAWLDLAGPRAGARVVPMVNEIFQRDVTVTFLGPRMNKIVAHRHIKGLNSLRQGGSGATF